MVQSSLVASAPTKGSGASQCVASVSDAVHSAVRLRNMVEQCIEERIFHCISSNVITVYRFKATGLPLGILKSWPGFSY